MTQTELFSTAITNTTVPKKAVTIVTDGSCLGNPGTGGWACLLQFGPHRKELSGAEAATTNNRMELTALVVALEALKCPCAVTLICDSEYVKKGVKGAHLWLQRGKAVKNADLWTRFLQAAAPHDLSFEWVRGHSGHPGNERCDQLAREAARALAGAAPTTLAREECARCSS